ncbi:uncharacterized protein LOC121764183 [Salvia splendens]|uniref:uncharacterized protein LOC121764183 n=1 Tax=Salvia splendens TaxID=180675 RepID=UPI001C267691|nr:uncharacterized protein LOC121764183 [Salvia splendens]
MAWKTLTGSTHCTTIGISGYLSIDFPLGSMIRTISISESENTFYKNFLKPHANIAKFYLNFNNALEFQRNVEQNMVDTYKLGDNNHNSYFVRHDKTDESYSCECKLFDRQGYLCSHIFFLFENNEVKKILEKYCESRWMKTLLAKVVHGQFDDTLPTGSIIDDRQIVSNQGISMFYGGVEELGNSLQSGTPTMFASVKRRVIEEFYGMVRPKVVKVHPPDVVKTKGHASSSASRLISKREMTIKEASRPLRRCKACD